MMKTITAQDLYNLTKCHHCVYLDANDNPNEVFALYVEQEYDLYSQLIVDYSDWSTFSYSIKQIAKQIGFQWHDSDPSGVNSIAWYNKYLEHPDQDNLLNR